MKCSKTVDHLGDREIRIELDGFSKFSGGFIHALQEQVYLPAVMIDVRVVGIQLGSLGKVFQAAFCIFQLGVQRGSLDQCIYLHLSRSITVNHAPKIGLSLLMSTQQEVEGSSEKAEKYVLMKCLDGMTGLRFARASRACCRPRAFRIRSALTRELCTWNLSRIHAEVTSSNARTRSPLFSAARDLRRNALTYFSLSLSANVQSSLT
ncbi:hypothetical protein MSG28_006169 [Choristoneura fumiferana]|uniref:Uncharacterized protein n=1 Tax=Choristoneura fumiferana TaxID=7141 RepID=A0ACC0JDX5_CHOFU|nr:hypothetical protein MSG28_006169 [Choristoneura fumiferana]